MRVPFRQGLLSFQKIGSTPTFLQQSSTDSTFVSQIVEPTPIVATFAHGTSDYLQVFDTTVDLAWGPILNTTTYLFWDMDRFTGAITRGTTVLEPVVSLLTPQSPVNGQNWFDLNVNKMKMWKASTSSWVEVIRVFAGRINGSTITANNEGTQVGINTPATAGYVMLDTLLNPLRKSNGEFLTDSEPSYVRTTSSTSGVLVQPVSKVIIVKAAESIPRMSLVYFSAADTVRLASSSPALMPNRVPVGMIMDQLNIGDQGTVVVGGEISYDQWDWSATPGAALYATSSGQVTTNRPAGLMAYRVGFVKNANTIIFNVDAETTPQVYTANENAVLISGIDPVVITDELNGLGERVVTIAVDEATSTLPGLLSASGFNLLGAVESRLTGVEADVTNLELNKADAGHMHVIADVTDLQTTLDAKAAIIHTHVAADVTDLQPLLDAKANAVHMHVIPDVTGLQTALNQKAFAVHLNEFDEIFETVTRTPGSADVGSGATLASALAAKADVVHIHAIADVTNLQAELSNRAFAVHTHSIAQITGLQTELNTKAAIIHTHVIGDVIGLSAALAIKSDIGHTHVIADVTGLQTALTTLQTNIDGKADTVHTHVITDVIGLQAALDSKAAVAHVHAISAVTGLQAALDSKADSVHTHIITDVTGLQDALDAKANAVHTHIIADVTGLQDALGTKADVGHVHVIADVTGLADALTLIQDTLLNKTDVGHTHVIADVTDLQSELDSKAMALHTHSSSNISNFAEAVDDRVAALIVPGANITATYDDVAGTLTLASTGGGGSELQTAFTTQELDPNLKQLFDFNESDPVSGFPVDPWLNSVPGEGDLVAPTSGFGLIPSLGGNEFGQVLRFQGSATPSAINFPIPAPSQLWTAEFWLSRSSSSTWTPGHSRVITINSDTPQQITVDILEDNPSFYTVRFTIGTAAPYIVNQQTEYGVNTHFMIEVNTFAEYAIVFSNGQPIDGPSTSVLGLSNGAAMPWVAQIGVAGVAVQPLPVVNFDNYRLMSATRIGGFNSYTPELAKLLYVPIVNSSIVTSAITFTDSFTAQILSGLGTSVSPASIQISGVAGLDDLSDVVLNTTFTGQGTVLKFDGFTWSNGVLNLDDLADVNVAGYTPQVGSVLTYVGGGGSGDWIAQVPQATTPYVKSFGLYNGQGPSTVFLILDTNSPGVNTGAPQPFPAENVMIYPDPFYKDSENRYATDYLPQVSWEYIPRDLSVPGSEEIGLSVLRFSRNGYYQINLKAVIQILNTVAGSNTGMLYLVAKDSYGKRLWSTIITDPFTPADKITMFGDDLTSYHSLNVNFNVSLPGNDGTGEDVISIEIYNTIAADVVTGGTVQVGINTVEVGVIALSLDDARPFSAPPVG